MKLVLSVLLAIAVVAPTLVKAESVQSGRSQAMQEYVQRKQNEITALEADLRSLQNQFEHATVRKTASGVAIIVGLFGSPLASGAALTLWGYDNEQECKAGTTCRLVIAGLIISDVVMIAGGGAELTISVVQRDMIMRNIKTKLTALATQKQALQFALAPPPTPTPRLN